MIIIELPEVASLPQFNIRDVDGRVNKSIPKEQGVYFIFDISGNCIYIGYTINLFQRLGFHSTKNKNKNNSYIPIGEAVNCSFILWTDLPVDTEIAETIYLNHYKPKYNGNPYDPLKLVSAMGSDAGIARDIDRMVF